MIDSLMLCGIGVLAGCLLMLMFIPLVHQRAVRLTKQQIVDATPLMVNEIQADKDHLRAEFAMSVRRLEISLEEMRAKAASRYGYIDKQNAEISRLQIELDRKTALIFALRTREEVRKGIVRRTLKILLYFCIRAQRRRRLPPLAPVHGDIDKLNAKISSLQVELDKRIALIFALRTRERGAQRYRQKGPENRPIFLHSSLSSPQAAAIRANARPARREQQAPSHRCAIVKKPLVQEQGAC